MFHKKSTRHAVLSEHYNGLLASSHGKDDCAVHYENAGEIQSNKSYSGNIKKKLIITSDVMH
jgi:hypothetical protein